MKILFGSIGILLVFFNLFQTWQMSEGILHPSLMTKAFYLSTFGQTTYPSAEQQKLLLIDKGDAYFQGFKNENEYRISYSKKFSFRKSESLNDSIIYTPIIDILPSEITQKDHCWIRSTWKYEEDTEALEGKVFTASALYKSKAYGWVGRTISDSLIQLDTIKKTIVFDYLAPDIRTKNDPIRIIVWKQSGLPIYIESVLIEGFERKK